MRKQKIRDLLSFYPVRFPGDFKLSLQIKHDSEINDLLVRVDKCTIKNGYFPFKDYKCKIFLLMCKIEAQIKSRLLKLMTVPGGQDLHIGKKINKIMIMEATADFRYLGIYQR